MMDNSSDPALSSNNNKNGYKVKILRAELPAAIQEKAIKKVAACLGEKMIEKDIATAVKVFLDEDSPTWHVIVGRNFGSSISHETKMLFFFQIDQTYVLLFKSSE